MLAELDGAAPRLNGAASTTHKPTELSMLVGPPLPVSEPIALRMLRNSFTKFSDKVAIASMFQPAGYLESIFENVKRAPPGDGECSYLRWTYAQLRHAGELLAVALAERGVTEGSTVAVLHHGSLDFYILFYAALLLRCRFAAINYHSISNAEEIQYMLKTVDAKVVCATDDKSMQQLMENVPALADDHYTKIVIQGPRGQANGAASTPYEYLEHLILGASERGSKAILERFETIEQSPDDQVLVIFTSGTSSLPKAVALTNYNMTAIAANYGRGPASGPTAVTCNHLPIYHIAAIVSGGWNPLANGGAIVHPAPSFTASSTVNAIRREGVTFMVLVPSMIGLLVNDPALPPPDQMSINFISLGASTILYTDVEKCYEYFGAKRVITSYGMTEGLMMTRGYLPREPTKEAMMGIQTVTAGTRLKICAPNSTEPLPRGEAGEVHQGGASTVMGYIGKESDAFYDDRDGRWCKTGDQAIMHEDGGVQIVGRYKDLVIRGGVNISPQAIEGVISRILNLEAHVVGMPDSIAGEVPVAIVRDADVGKASPNKLRAAIIKELGPRYALEKFITLGELGMKNFPKTSTGKIRKVDLQAAVRQYAREHAADEAADITESAAGASSLERLYDIWSELSGIDRPDLKPETSIREFADSLMMARYASIVQNKFGRPFTLADLEKAETLGEQATLLDSRGEEKSATSDLYHDRTVAPAGDDIVFVGKDDAEHEHTKYLCEKTLIPMGFTWEDVEDVARPSQWLQSWVKSRETSDRFRAAYISANADIATFTDAFTEALRRNDSLRAVSIPDGQGSDIQVFLRPTPKWQSKVIHIHPTPVKKLADLEKLIPGDAKLNHGLAQVIIAEVEETQSAGCCIVTLHSTFDAFSLNIVRNDVNSLLNKVAPKQHIPYKLWADHLHNTELTAMANSSVGFNVRRLRGLASKRAALWPPQRSPVWQRGCDRGLHVTPDGQVTTPDDPKQRRLLDGANARGSDGIRREIRPVDLNTLTVKHRIPAPILFKAALVLLETRLTGQREALFTQTFSMRDSWPFIPDWMSRRLPSPLEVTGPTLARVAEIVPIDRSRNLLDWFNELKVEQEELIKHCHAPYRFVFNELNRISQEEQVNGDTNGVFSPTVAGSAEEKLKARHRSSSTRSKSNSVSYASPTASTRSRAGTIEKPATPTSHRSRAGTLEKLDTNVPRSRASTLSKYKHDGTNGVNGNHTLSSPISPSTPSTPMLNQSFLPPALDGAVMESIRKRINFQWLPLFAPDKKLKPLFKNVSSSHFNEVGLAIKAGMLADRETVWVRMEWDDGNICAAETHAWTAEMAKYVEIMGKEDAWSKTVEEIYAAAGF